MALELDILKKVVRIEVVVNEESLDSLIELFRDANVRGYTIIKGAGGLGSTGERNPDDYILQQPNAVVILACEEDQAESILRILHPELKDFGGMCLVSECQWVLGPAASY